MLKLKVGDSMSYMIEVYYRSPVDARHEAEIALCAESHGGQLDFQELPAGGKTGPVCLTFEFVDRAAALVAVDCLRGRGEHVEGPNCYGD